MTDQPAPRFPDCQFGLYGSRTTRESALVQERLAARIAALLDEARELMAARPFNWFAKSQDKLAEANRCFRAIEAVAARVRGRAYGCALDTCLSGSTTLGG